MLEMNEVLDARQDEASTGGLDGLTILRCQSGKFLDLLMTVAGVVEKSGSPISTRFVRLRRQERSVIALAVGTEVEIEIEDSGYDLESSLEVIVEYWPLVRLLKNIRTDETVSLIIRQRDAVLAGRVNRYPITVLNPSLFIDARRCDAGALKKRSLEVPAASLITGLNFVMHAVESGNREEAQNGAWVRWQGRSAALIAEGQGMVANAPLLGASSDEEEGAWQIRESACKEVLRLVKGFGGAANLTEWERDGKSILEISLGRSKIRTGTIASLPFAEWEAGFKERVKIGSTLGTMTVARRDLAEALRRLKGDSRGERVTISLNGGAWDLVCGTDRRFSEERLQVDGVAEVARAMNERSITEHLVVKLDALLEGCKAMKGFTLTISACVGSEGGSLWLEMRDESLPGSAIRLQCLEEAKS